MIKDVQPNQYPELLEVQIDCIRNLTNSYQPEEIARWIDYLEAATPDRFAAFENYAWSDDQGRISGFISWSEERSLGTAAIECLYVRDELRGRGIGRLLLHTAEDSMPTNTYITVRSTVNARPFYEKNDYTFTEQATSRAGFNIAVLEKQRRA